MDEFPLAIALRREIDAEIEALERRAVEQGEALVAAAQAKCRKLATATRSRLEEECDLRLKRGLSRLDLDSRNSLLRFRERELDQVFQLAEERLATMKSSSPERYQQLFQGVYARCRALLPKGEVRVRIDKDLEELQGWLQQQAQTEVLPEARLEGLVVESLDGRLHCDGTIPYLLRTLRRERAADLERILFGEEL